MNTIISWLMEGDPAIRWQTMRDLLDAPEAEWQAEQARTLQEGWGAAYLAHQDADGRWGGGIYSPKWISTTYTLLTLRSIGIPRTCEAAQRGAAVMFDGMLGAACDDTFRRKLADCDRCIVGMMLSLAIYFEINDARVDAMTENVLAEIMPDGAWNCRKHRRPYPGHSSFHTTLNVLDGVRDAIELRPNAYTRDLLRAEASALELLRQHHLFRSDKTGQIIHPQFVEISYPHYWHYDALRALCYMARANAPRDPRCQEAINLLHQRRHADGTWPKHDAYSGKLFFRMEKGDRSSRWNTLRALRVLRWWEGGEDTAQNKRRPLPLEQASA